MKLRIAGTTAAVVLLMVGLAACSEQPQLLEGQRMGHTVTRDTNSWEGDPMTFQTQFQRGDRQAWERTLTQRLQGQNEYIRIGD